MNILVIWIAVFVLSLIVLIKSSDWFTDAAEKIGLYLGIPAFIVGVTIVAMGTSLPELISSIFAVARGSSEIVAGNVVGSNITNIFLVLGLASAWSAKKIKISFELIHVDLPILIGSALLLAIMLMDGVFTWYEAVLSLLGIVIYIWYTTKSESDSKEKKILFDKKDFIKRTLILVFSGAGIFIGAKYVIDAVIEISSIINVGTDIIAIGAVALGTSLPELMVSINAVRKGNNEMAVGNVLGSNIFNSFVVMGIPGLIAPLVISPNIISLGIPLMVIATLLYFFITQDRQITRYEGLLLVLFYLFFIGKILMIA